MSALLLRSGWAVLDDGTRIDFTATARLAAHPSFLDTPTGEPVTGSTPAERAECIEAMWAAAALDEGSPFTTASKMAKAQLAVTRPDHPAAALSLAEFMGRVVDVDWEFRQAETVEKGEGRGLLDDGHPFDVPPNSPTGTDSP